MVPLGVLRNSTTGTTIVIQFDFHRNSIQILAECIVHGRSEGFCGISPSLVDVILQKGPTLCSASQRTVLSDINVVDPTRISVSSEKVLLSLQSCFFFIFNCREKDTCWKIELSSHSTITIPKPTPSSTLFRLIPLSDSEAYVILEDASSVSVLFCACGFAATVVSISDSFVSLSVTYFFGTPSLALQLAHSFYLIRSNSILFRTPFSLLPRRHHPLLRSHRRLPLAWVSSVLLLLACAFLPLHALRFFPCDSSRRQSSRTPGFSLHRCSEHLRA